MATLEITIYGQDMMDYLRPEELQSFLKARDEAEHDEYNRLISLVRERKLTKERRVAALIEIAPPYRDAKRYLSDQEYQQFRGSLLGAADGYLTGGRGCPFGNWRLGDEAIHYAVFEKTIKERKAAEARQKQAQLEHDQFIKEIDDVEKKLKQELTKEKKPSFAYPTWLAGYHPDLWCELALPTEKQIKDWARPQIRERVPQTLTEFVSWDLSWEVQAEPHARYKMLHGIPCLAWHFAVLILVRVHLKEVGRKFTKEFQGREYSMEITDEALGTFFLGPVLGGEREGFTTPIALLTLLAKDELGAPGIEVVEHGSPFTTFTIQGFEEGVQIHEGFLKFIIGMGKDGDLPDALLGKHVVDQVTATLMKGKGELPLPLPQPVGGEVTVAGSASDNSDVAAALQVMGFKGMEIQQGMEAAHLSPGLTLEEKIKAVLKIMDS